MQNDTTKINSYQVAVIGAGFGGIVAARAFKPLAGDGLVVFEKAKRAGGVWRDNVYPGCACDIPSDLYAIKSVPNPKWPGRFSSQSEILAYMEDTVRKSGIAKYIRYETGINSIRFVTDRGEWLLTDDAGQTYFARMVIMATGSLNRPRLPFAGELSNFKGRVFHSAQWDSSYDYSGKRVAVIGTGASAIQIIPAIAPDVAELHVFQRSPAWVIPRFQSKRSGFKQFLYKYLPPLQALSRELTYWQYELFGLALTGNAMLNKLLSMHAAGLLRRQVKDPNLRRKLTPDDKLGCKRILVSDNYYKAFNRPHVHLVTDDIGGMVSNGIRAKDGKVTEVDLIVLATGFDVAAAIGAVAVEGLAGHTLRGDHAENIEAYKGMNAANYPNFSFIMGPNSGIGHISVIHMIESQVDYLVKYWKALAKSGADTYLDVKPEVQKQYNDEIKSVFGKTVWASGCKSWYLADDGRNFTLYPELAYKYRKQTRKFDIEDYVVRVTGKNLRRLIR